MRGKEPHSVQFKTNNMKTFWVAVILALLVLNVQAQWYSRSFGVNSINDLSEVQLNYSLQRAEANVHTGKILTYSGIGAFTLGTIIAASGVHGFWNGVGDDDLNQYVAGSMLMLLGMGSTAVGIPFWISGAIRKKKVEIALLRFNSSAFTGYRQPEQIGLSLKISF